MDSIAPPSREQGLTASGTAAYHIMKKMQLLSRYNEGTKGTVSLQGSWRSCSVRVKRTSRLRSWRYREHGTGKRINLYCQREQALCRKCWGRNRRPAATQIRIPLPAFTRFHSHEPSRTEEFSSVLSSMLGGRICQFRRPRTCSLYSFSGRPGRLRMPLSLSEAHPGKLPQVSLGVGRGV